MLKKYKITSRLSDDRESVVFDVRMRLLPGLWVSVKKYHEPDDHAFARMLAEELIEKLTEG